MLSLGLRFHSLQFQVQGLECRVHGSGFRVQGLGFGNRDPGVLSVFGQPHQNTLVCLVIDEEYILQPSSPSGDFVTLGTDFFQFC